MSGFILGRVRHALFEQRWITAALAVTLLAISLLLGWQLERRESADQLRQVNVQAQILAGSVAGALAFDDATTANEYLSALRLDESFRGAAVYGADGRLFAGLAVPGQALPANVTIHPPEISGRKVTVVVPVVQANLNLGSVYLTKIVEPLSTRISRYAAIGLILVFAAALIALLGAASAAAAGANRELQRQILAREKAEIALRQAQKMEALGQLTGGVAHDFNNLLMAASSGLELMQRSQDAERRQKFAEGIRNALDRGAQITQQLLAFSRAGVAKPAKSVPFTAQELQHLTELTKNAVGFDAARGDSVSVVNQAFHRGPAPEELPETPLWDRPGAMDLIKQGLGVLIALLVAFGLLRPLLKGLLRGEVAARALPSPMPKISVRVDDEPAANEPARLGAVPTLAYEQRIGLARRMVGENSKQVAQVVKNWVSEDGN